MSDSSSELILSNDCTVLALNVRQGVPSIRYLENRKTGFRWQGHDDIPMVSIPGFDFSGSDFRVYETEGDADGLSAKGRIVTMTFEKEEQRADLRFRILPSSPFLTLSLSLSGHFSPFPDKEDNTAQADGVETKTASADPDREILFACPLSDKHLKIRAATLHDCTDSCNTLVTEEEPNVYPFRALKISGHIFRLSAYLHKETLMMIKEAPCRDGQLHPMPYDLKLAAADSVRITGTGLDFTTERDFEQTEFLYSVTFGAVSDDDALPLWRERYRLDCTSLLSAGLNIMSNTWGDRNQDAAVCESFMLSEIRRADTLHVQAIQIDDGWQSGITANSKKEGKVWGRCYYAAQSDFWEPNSQKFPSGLNKVTNTAQENGHIMGLWFSPDLSNEYENCSKDIDVLLGLWRKFGIRFFKLDGIHITSEQVDQKLLTLIRTVNRESGGQVKFNFDITAGVRWGYLPHREFGNLFVENRYTDWTNYHPHATLRNLWMLAPYIPTARLQMEFLNPRRNEDRYGDDPLRPGLYRMDYLFASVMFANPLCWMEMSHLTEEDVRDLKAITTIWEPHRKELALCDVAPIGQKPDGVSFTGFCARRDDQKGYLLLIRESGTEDTYVYSLPEIRDCELIPLYQSGKASASVQGEQVLFRAPEVRSFLFAEYHRR